MSLLKTVGQALGFLGPSGFDGTTMTTPDKAQYVSPSGQKVIFDFEDVISSYDKKASIFETAVGDGTYVQDNGHTSGRFPMAAIFHGSGYEKRAEAFLSAVLEPGVGILFHPQYSKPINVVPVGTIERSDAYVSGTNQTIFSLVFYETTGLQIGEDKGLGQSFDSFIDASAADFSNNVRLDNIADQQSFIGKVKNTMKKVETVMKRGTQGLTNATKAVENVGESINRGMDILIGSPLTMAYQVQMLIGEPARQAALAKAKLKAYGDLAADIFGGDLAARSSYNNDGVNAFHFDRLVSACVVANSAKLADSATDQFTSRADFVNQAESLKTLLASYQEWNDNNYDAIEGGLIYEPTTDTGGGLHELHDLVARAGVNLITRSFDAKTEMRQVLASERTPIDLVFELYGSASYEMLDFFAQTNDLGGDEFFLIPKGREIAWYV